MDAAGSHSWRRPRYPLQALSNGSAQSSTAVSPSEQADDTASDWLPDSTQCYDGSASWHRAVTGDQSERCPLMSQVGDDTKRFSRPVDDTEAIHDRSVACSLLQHSASSILASCNQRLGVGETENTSSSIQLLVDGDNDSSQAPAL